MKILLLIAVTLANLTAAAAEVPSIGEGQPVDLATSLGVPRIFPGSTRPLRGVRQHGGMVVAEYGGPNYGSMYLYDPATGRLTRLPSLSMYDERASSPRLLHLSYSTHHARLGAAEIDAMVADFMQRVAELGNPYFTDSVANPEMRERVRAALSRGGSVEFRPGGSSGNPHEARFTIGQNGTNPLAQDGILPEERFFLDSNARTVTDRRPAGWRLPD
ncbi:MAG: hypothetical protein HYZ75_13165 [Elusimicrobia bacterium]|nr:hypothetical protein [Elusimicrobiota bacterium]